MLRRTEAARQTTLRFLTLWRNAGFFMYNLDAFAVMVADSGKFADAARLAGASQAFVRRTGVWLPPLGPDWARRERSLCLFARWRASPDRASAAFHDTMLEHCRRRPGAG